MPSWTKSDGTKTATNPRKAKRKVNERMASIRETLAAIETELEKYESLRCPDWGHAGDLAHVDERLAEVYDFMRGAG